MTKNSSNCYSCNKKPAVTYRRIDGRYLCKDCFSKWLLSIVRKTISQKKLFERDDRIIIGLSGGKDSTVALHIIHDIFSQRPPISLYAITVDEGIKGYRDESKEIAINNCKKLGIEHHIVNFKKVVGKTMDEIASINDELGECSYCGVFRRLCLNSMSKELEITKLVTGHNLDDTAQSILMNFVNGDIQKLVRLGPHRKVQPGLVPRMLPLRVIPEKENALYAIFKNIE